MSFKRIFVWVEGPDDFRYFETMVRPLLSATYDWIDIVQYASMTDKIVVDFIQSIVAMGADYIFARDIDRFPCITAAKIDVRPNKNYCSRPRNRKLVSRVSKSTSRAET